MIMIDEALIIRQAKENSIAFAALYETYIDRIFAYAWRETGDRARAQDVAAATFEYALRHIDRYQDRGYNFGAWLYQIARSEIAGLYRKQRRLLPWTRAATQLEAVTIDPKLEQLLETDGKLRLIAAGLTHLAQRDQEIVRLHFYEGLSHAEIAIVLEASTHNVAVRLHRAIKRLQQQVARLQEEQL